MNNYNNLKICILDSHWTLEKVACDPVMRADASVAENHHGERTAANSHGPSDIVVADAIPITGDFEPAIDSNRAVAAAVPVALVVLGAAASDFCIPIQI